MLLKFKQKNPYVELFKEISFSASKPYDKETLKRFKTVNKYADIWEDGYKRGLTNPQDFIDCNPWKRAPNRILWSIGAFAARCDSDPEYNSVFRKIVK